MKLHNIYPEVAFRVWVNLWATWHPCTIKRHRIHRKVPVKNEKIPDFFFIFHFHQSKLYYWLSFHMQTFADMSFPTFILVLNSIPSWASNCTRLWTTCLESFMEGIPYCNKPPIRSFLSNTTVWWPTCIYYKHFHYQYYYRNLF